MKHVVLYVGHMYKPFWTKKNWPGWQGGSGKVKIGQNIANNGPCFWLRSPLETPKWVKDPWNGPRMTPQLPLIDLSSSLSKKNVMFFTIAMYLHRFLCVHSAHSVHMYFVIKNHRKYASCPLCFSFLKHGQRHLGQCSFSPKHCIPSELVNIPSLGKVNITHPDFTLYGEWERGKPEYTISSYFPADT